MRRGYINQKKNNKEIETIESGFKKIIYLGLVKYQRMQMSWKGEGKRHHISLLTV